MAFCSQPPTHPLPSCSASYSPFPVLGGHYPRCSRSSAATDTGFKVGKPLLEEVYWIVKGILNVLLCHGTQNSNNCHANWQPGPPTHATASGNILHSHFQPSKLSTWYFGQCWYFTCLFSTRYNTHSNSRFPPPCQDSWSHGRMKILFLWNPTGNLGSTIGFISIAGMEIGWYWM